MELENILPQNLFLSQTQKGPLDNFLYLLGCKETREMTVVDPAWDVDFLCREADAHGFKITNIFLTHGHPDHVNGLQQLLARHDVPVYLSRHEAKFLTPSHPNVIRIDDGQILNTGNINWQAIHMPGHTPGCQSFKYENILIAGDVLFIDACGRCDLPGGDARVQYRTLYQTLMKLPDSTIIFPGHNYGPSPFDTLANQKQTNPYLTCEDEEEFLRTRMGFV